MRAKLENYSTMKGRKPKTTTEHKTQGTFQPVRHATRMQNIDVDELPAPPAEFNARHRERWNVVGHQMLKQGAFSETDYDALRIFVELDLVRVDAHKKYLEKGQAKDWRIYRESAQQQKRLMDDMGFTPRSRMSMKVERPPKKENNVLSELMDMVKRAEDILPDA